jgi:hypothetical protein
MFKIEQRQAGDLGFWTKLNGAPFTLDNFRLRLDQLGIDPEKEGEVYECGPERSLRVYGGWFYFAGELIEPGERMTDAGPVLQCYFAVAKRLPLPQPDFGKNVLAVEFSTKLPWMISELP